MAPDFRDIGHQLIPQAPLLGLRLGGRVSVITDSVGDMGVARATDMDVANTWRLTERPLC
jgi:hypothetical protein